MDAAQNRRRGPALEDAILDAAWAELIESGYANMTLESAAKRAGTSRPVLHRRWPGRIQLATAALSRYFALHPIEIPDLGDFAQEISALLRKFSDRFRPDLLRVALEMGGDLREANTNFAELRAEILTSRPIHAIIERGIQRGEIDPEKLTPRIVSLPGDLARNELMMTLKPLRDEAIHEIVHDIFLPLIRRRSDSPSPARKSSSSPP